MAGSIYKRCGCTEVDSNSGERRQRGSTCPDLKRPDGAWNPKHGKWGFTVGYVGPGGVRKQKARNGFATKAAAQSALDEFRARASKGQVINDQLTVADYLREWIKAKSDIKANTSAHYGRYIEKVWIPAIGHVRLIDLRVGHVAAVFDDINERNDRVARGAVRGRRTTGAASQQRMRAVLRSALSDAMREGLVTANVAALVKMPSGKRPKAKVWTEEREQVWRAEVHALLMKGRSLKRARLLATKPSPVMVWTPAQLGTFLDEAADHRLYALWHLLAHRGPRRGESIGLEWPDIDLNAGTATIERQRIAVIGKVIEDTPKSDAGGRVVALDRGCIEVLKAHRTQQRKDRLVWGEAWVNSGKVFTREDGSALDPEWVSDEFIRLCIVADLPPIRLHDLRHGAASLMLAANVDMKVVQETLGHANLATTANTYTSVYPDVALAAAEAASAIVPRRART